MDSLLLSIMKTLIVTKSKIVLGLALLLMVSCIKPVIPEDLEDPTPTPNPPVSNVAKTISEITITSFSISSEHNSNIYSEIAFINGTTFEGNQTVTHYKADLSSLKASFKTNASKVTIGSTTQTSGVTPNNFSNELAYRFYASDNNYIERKVKIINPSDAYSGLPILALFVDDGSKITNREVWKAGKVIIDPQGNEGIDTYNSTLEIKGRGNHSWGQPKKPYALKLTNKDPIFGMNKHKRWAVLANYSDRTLLRNRVSFEIAKRTGLAWTPDSRFVEVFLNGSYQGQYLITEQIRLDKNRININEDSGYLIEVDRYTAEADEFPFRPTISDLPVKMKSPEPATDNQKEYIINYFNTIESLIYKTPPAVPDSLEYHTYIDISSFIGKPPIKYLF